MWLHTKKRQKNFKPVNLLKKPLLFLETKSALKMLTTGHGIDTYFIDWTSPFNYIPVGGGIPP